MKSVRSFVIEQELQDKGKEDRKASLASIPSDLGIVPRSQSRLISVSDIGMDVEEMTINSKIKMPNSLVLAIESAQKEGKKEESKVRENQVPVPNIRFMDEEEKGGGEKTD